MNAPDPRDGQGRDPHPDPEPSSSLHPVTDLTGVTASLADAIALAHHVGVHHVSEGLGELVGDWLEDGAA